MAECDVLTMFFVCQIVFEWNIYQSRKNWGVDQFVALEMCSSNREQTKPIEQITIHCGKKFKNDKKEDEDNAWELETLAHKYFEFENQQNSKVSWTFRFLSLSEIQ